MKSITIISMYRIMTLTIDPLVGTKLVVEQEIVGIQGPCLECFNDTFCPDCWRQDTNLIHRRTSLILRSRFGLNAESQGSNHLILSEVFRRYHFDTKVLLVED